MLGITVVTAGTFQDWISNIGTWGLGLVALVVGLGLIGRGIMDLWSALGKENKEWSKALVGFIVGTLGGLIGWWGAKAIISFFQGNSSEIPKK